MSTGIDAGNYQLWKSRQEMEDYACKSRIRAEVIAKTRRLDWYSEELLQTSFLIRPLGISNILYLLLYENSFRKMRERVTF